MNQQEFDFNKDINEATYTVEENLRIDKIVSDYQAKKNTINDEAIIIKLFFEEYCIEISKRLKSLGYLNGTWEFESNSFGRFYYDFINDKQNFNNSTLSEFIVLYLYKINSNVRVIDFQNNSISNFIFDRKITESILEKIQIEDFHNAALYYIIYLKIWNQFKIYNNPFNNNKALLIHRIFADKVWPKNLLSYEAINEFEKSIQKLINYLSDKNIYLPFFDTQANSYYSENYLLERAKLKENIEKLFEYDLTDESEPYHCLIKDLINKPTESDYKKNIIISKVDKQMMPNEEDFKMFLKLYECTFEKELGKTILSKFYMYNFLNYDH
jgi:hypothetical protein